MASKKPAKGAKKASKSLKNLAPRKNTTEGVRGGLMRARRPR